jgi:uncharacterized protein YrzB (UPF0473 family)
MRTGSAENFCPPVEEGVVLTFADEKGDEVSLEFLGLILKDDRSYGFFVPASEESDEEEVIILEVTELDEEGQPASFELVFDEAIAAEVYADFKEATKDLYDFA